MIRSTPPDKKAAVGVAAFTRGTLKRELQRKCSAIILAGAALFVLVGLALVGRALPTAHADTPLDDPFPVRRLVLPPDQLAEEVRKKNLGILQQLPRKDFETQMLKAAKELNKETPVPRLLKARYWAELDGSGLKGSGDWALHHTASQPGILPLGELQLALDNVRFHNRQPAVLGLLQNKLPGLLVEGIQTVLFDWSLGSSSSPGELHFDFQVPPCAANSLELKIPEEFIVQLSPASGVLLTGPHSADRDGYHLWRLNFGGKSRINFVLHQTHGRQAVKPLQTVNLTTRQKLFPDHLQAEYYFEIQVHHNVIDELIFDLDSSLQPIKVHCQSAVVELKNWRIEELTIPQDDKTPLKKRFLVVQFAQPQRGALPPLQITCQTPLPRDRWHSPRLWLRDGLTRKETLHLSIYPDVEISDWKNGSFRLVQSTKDTQGVKKLTLNRTSVEHSEPPSALLRTQESILSAQQNNWWQVSEQGSTFRADFTFRVQQGKCHHLQIELPKHWKDGGQVESVELLPEGLLRGWVTYADGAKWMLHLDLKRSLSMEQQAQLRLLLRSPSGPKIGPKGRNFDFPVVIPSLTGPYSGSLGISVDPLFSAETSDTNRAPTPPSPARPVSMLEPTKPDAPAKASKPDAPAKALKPDAPAKGTQPPWKDVLPQFFFAFRQEPVTGKLRLLPQPSQFRTRWQGDALVRHNEATVVATLDLEPVRGAVPFVDLYFTAPLANKPKCRMPTARNKAPTLQRLTGKEMASALLPLGARDGFQLALLQTAAPRGQWWRLVFDTPIKTQTSVVVEFSSARGGDRAARLVPKLQLENEEHENGDHLEIDNKDDVARMADTLEWEIPLPVINGSLQTERAVSLNALNVDIEAVHRQGLSPGRGTNAFPVNGEPYFYSSNKPPHPMSRLWVQTRPALPGQPLRERCDYAHLTTIVRDQDELLHHFRFEIKNWRQPTLELRLPAGVRPICARVQGQWTPHVDHQKGEQHVHVALPADAAASSQWFELVFVTEAVPSSWNLMNRVHAPLPELPVPPFQLRRTWRLEPKLTPLGSASMLQVLPARQEATNSLVDSLQSSWNIAANFRSWIGAPYTAPANGSENQQTLLQAEQTFRKERGKQSWYLGNALRWMFLQSAAAPTPLVIDAFALESAKVLPHTAVYVDDLSSDRTHPYQPFWEDYGMVLEPLGGGSLLTTSEQWAAWQEEGFSTALQKSLQRSLKEALLYGTDSSGRFQTVLVWSTAAAPQAEAERNGLPLLRLLMTSQEPGWTEWEPLPGAVSPNQLTIMHTPSLMVLGGLLAVLVGFGCWFAARRMNQNWRLRMLLFLLLSSLVLHLWLPDALQWLIWPPALAAGAILIFFLLRFSKSSRLQKSDEASQQKNSRRILVAGGSILLLGMCAWWLASVAQASSLVQLTQARMLALRQVQEAKPYPVFILGSATAKIEEQKVLVPAELLQKLQQVHEQSKLQLADAVLVGARYKGEVKDDVAEVTAELQCYCFSDDVMLSLPFKGIQLREGALVEGAPVFPVPIPGQGGYRIRITGRKDRFINLRIPFSVPVRQSKSTRSIEFSIPRLLQNRLTLDLPKDSTSIQAVTARGRQHLEPESNRVRLETDLGMADFGIKESKVHIVWYSSANSGKESLVDVSEYHLMNLQSPTSNLKSTFKYQIRKGSLDVFQIRLPPTMKVRHVEVGVPLPAGPVGPAVRLKSWRVQEGENSRILQVQLHSPAAADVLLALDLIGATPIDKGQTDLKLPVPLGVQRMAGTNPVEGMFAFWSENEKYLDKAFQLSFSSMPRENFSQQWQNLGMARPDYAIQAYRFKRIQPGNLATLRFVTPTAPPTAQQEIHWLLHPNHADVEATLTVHSAKPDLILLQWEVPAELTVADVVCPDMMDWSATIAGDKKLLQIWLSKPQQRVTMQLKGWFPATKRTSPPTGWSLPPMNGKKKFWLFRIPVFTFLSSAAYTTTIQVTAHKGLTLRPRPPVNMELVSKDEPLVYIAQRKSYTALIEAHSAAIKPDIHTLMVCAEKDKGVQITGHVHCRIPVGELRSLSLALEDKTGTDFQLDAPRAVKIDKKKEGNTTRWNIMLPRGITQTYTLKVFGLVPSGEDKTVEVPSLLVENGENHDVVLALASPNLEIVEEKGLVRQKTLPPRFVQWIPDRDKITRQGKLWQLAAGASCRIREIRAAAAPDVEVVFAEQIGTWMEEGRWIHEGFYVLSLGKVGNVHPTALRLSLPPQANIASIMLNGQAAAPRYLDNSGNIQISLPEYTPLVWLTVRWTYLETADTLHQPVATPIQFEGRSPPALWTIHVPPGYAVAEGGSGTQPTVAELHRADSLLRLSAIVGRQRAQKPSPELDRELEKTQQAFYWYCLQGAIRLGAITTREDNSAPDVGDAQGIQWLTKLKKQNHDLAQKYTFETIRAAAEDQPSLPAFWHHLTRPGLFLGYAASWHDSDGDAAPVVQLVSDSDRRLHQRLWTTQLLIAALLLSWILCSIPGVVTLLRWTWPEQLLALSIIGTIAFGVSLVGVFLFAAAVGSRIAIIVLAVRRLWRQWITRTAAAGSGIHSAG